MIIKQHKYSNKFNVHFTLDDRDCLSDIRITGFCCADTDDFCMQQTTELIYSNSE